jgi:hypothetical protein
MRLARGCIRFRAELRRAGKLEKPPATSVTDGKLVDPPPFQEPHCPITHVNVSTSYVSVGQEHADSG